jgi:uncharacterized OsmC-like protein
MPMPVIEIAKKLEANKMAEKMMAAGFTMQEARIIVDMTANGVQKGMEAMMLAVSPLETWPNPMMEIQAAMLGCQIIQVAAAAQMAVIKDFMDECGVAILQEREDGSTEVTLPDGANKH